MKKHILGFAVFSFIVAATMFGYKFFNSFETDKTYNYTSSRSCRLTKPQPATLTTNVAAPFVRQAVLDTQTRILYWELSAPKIDSAIKLHFFVKNENGTRYISSSPGVRSDLNGGNLTFESSLMWMDNLNSYENLYVAAEAVPASELHIRKYEPKFDASKATAISLHWGK